MGGERALVRKGWVPGDNLKRLTLTADAIEMARAGGRHAKVSYSLARAKLSPMTIEEAWETILAVVRAWLLARH